MLFDSVWICNMTFNFLWRRPLSYRNQSIDLERKAIDWFVYDNDLRHERIKTIFQIPSKISYRLLDFCTASPASLMLSPFILFILFIFFNCFRLIYSTCFCVLQCLILYFIVQYLNSTIQYCTIFERTIKRSVIKNKRSSFLVFYMLTKRSKFVVNNFAFFVPIGLRGGVGQVIYYISK